MRQRISSFFSWILIIAFVTIYIPMNLENFSFDKELSEELVDAENDEDDTLEDYELRLTSFFQSEASGSFFFNQQAIFSYQFSIKTNDQKVLIRPPRA